MATSRHMSNISIIIAECITLKDDVLVVRTIGS